MPRRSGLAMATTSVAVGSSHTRRNASNHSGGSGRVPIVRDDPPQWGHDVRVAALPNSVGQRGPTAVESITTQTVLCVFY